MFKVIFLKNIFSLLNLFSKKKKSSLVIVLVRSGWIFQDLARILIEKKRIVMGTPACRTHEHCWAV
jgi:hypothetical protein